MSDDIDTLLNYEDDDEVVEMTESATAGADAKKGHYVGLQSSSFKDFLLKAPLLRAIVDCGFEHPSEVQQYCIPQACLGMDVLCQAKAGMGKTAVFVLTVLHLLEFDEAKLGCIVLVHTREMALQIEKEFTRFAKYIEACKVKVFLGGSPVRIDKEYLEKEAVHIAVGSPGRMAQLARDGNLKCGTVKHFVIDECDKLLDNPEMRTCVQDIFIKTPHAKQVMMFSATMPEEVKKTARKYMQEKHLEIFIDDESKLVLHGLQQYYLKVTEAEKTRKLTDLLDGLDFNQCFVFVSKVQRAKELANLLVESNFPAVAMHTAMKQEERTKVYNGFKEGRSRIMVATDLVGRGIDVEKANVVINYDYPADTDSYIHRVGRAGRFGTKGLGISFVSSDEDAKLLEETKARFAVAINELPDSIDTSSYMEKK